MEAVEVEDTAFVATASATIDLAGGDLDAMDRDAAKAWIVGMGAKVASAMSSKTNLLIVGQEPGQKTLEKARELGTRTMSEAELRAALGAGAAPAPQVIAPPAASDDAQAR